MKTPVAIRNEWFGHDTCLYMWDDSVLPCIVRGAISFPTEEHTGFACIGVRPLKTQGPVEIVEQVDLPTGTPSRPTPACWS